MTSQLPQRLRSGTRDLHAQTERSGLMAELLAGRITLATYCGLLRNLHALYTALEAALEQAGADPAIAGLQTGPLRRAGALAADLHSLLGPRWPELGEPVPATLAYVQRLQALAQAGSRALVAHAYVRYLGDLHGGQVLRRLVARGLDLPGDVGTSFYDFGPPEQVLLLRQSLRSGLGSLPVSDEETALIVDEARWAFVQHQHMFEELATA